MRFVGHRGASHVLPETTMAAISAALSLGLSFECDLQVLSCGHVVLLHDDTLERTAAPWSEATGLEERQYRKVVRAPAATLSWDDVRSVDVGSWFDATHRDERVPLFSQALQALLEADVGDEDDKCVFAELKSVVGDEGGTGTMPAVDSQLVEAASAVAAAQGLKPEQLTWISFSRAVACEAKRRMPSHRALLIKQCGAVRLEPRTLAEITA